MGAAGDEIRQARRDLKLTQKELAAATGVGMRTITRIETGEAERDGKESETASLATLQRYLKVGPYRPGPIHGFDDPPLSQATTAELLGAIAGKTTFTELLGLLASKHGQEVRDAVSMALTGARAEGSSGPVPREILDELNAGRVPPGWNGPRRERGGPSGFVTPRYDGSEYDDPQDADRATRPDATG